MSKNKENLLSPGQREVWCETGYLRIDKSCVLNCFVFIII